METVNNQELPPVLHNYYLTTIKRMLNASFVAWVTEKDKKYLSVKIKGQNLSVPFEGGDIITEKAYQDLINNILKQYGVGDEIQEALPMDEGQEGA